MPIDSRAALVRPSGDHQPPGSASPERLPAEAFASLVASAPLISIDLVIENAQGQILLGLRKNPPAKDYWFVPGGRIHKGEKLDDAFARLTQDELGVGAARSGARLLGVYEHFYDTDFTGMGGKTTHYVVLAYRLTINRHEWHLPQQQHSEYQWIDEDRVAYLPNVHPYTQAYFATV
jgi:colanic acid biosynthesis protein WcaH